MTITKILTVTLVIAIFSGFGCMAFAAGGGGAVTDPGAMEGKHFHPKEKQTFQILPSGHSIP